MEVQLSAEHRKAIIKHCLVGKPNEACGLLVGPINDQFQPTGQVADVYPVDNADNSPVSYTVAPNDLLRLSRKAEENSQAIVGVWHSHTHTEAYPSPTDIRKAVDPSWIYMLVSLREAEPEIRAFRIANGEVSELVVH